MGPPATATCVHGESLGQVDRRARVTPSKRLEGEGAHVGLVSGLLKASPVAGHTGANRRYRGASVATLSNGDGDILRGSSHAHTPGSFAGRARRQRGAVGVCTGNRVA